MIFGISSTHAHVDGVFLTASNALYFLLISALILVYTYWYISRRHMYQLAEKIPGPKGWPLIENALDFVGSSRHEIFKIAMNYSMYYPNIVRVWAGPYLFVIITNPQDAEIILSSQVYLDKPYQYTFFKPWLGNGLLISTGQKWKAHRKLIAPTFHLNVLKNFIDLFNATSRITVARMEKEIGKTFDCHEHMATATVEILLETAMGVSKKVQKKSSFEYVTAVMKMCEILHYRHTKPLLYFNFFFKLSSLSTLQKQLLKTIHNLTHQVVKTKIEAFNKGIRGSIAELPQDIQKQPEQNNNTKTKTVVEGLSFGQSSELKNDLEGDESEYNIGEKKRLAFLDLLIESSQSGVVTEEEVREQVNTIMFEGHDTTAAASSFFLSLMGIHQDIQERVFRELESIFGNTNRPATFADTLEMKYLELCLLETIRLYPPVPIIARALKEDVKMASGDYTIPAGATVAIATYVIHRRADIYPNPNKFDPDNFLPEYTANRHYYGFIPFGAGPRSCVGRKYAMLKLKILLSTILRNYRIKSDLKESDFQLQGDIILKPSEGFNIKIEPRK